MNFSKAKRVHENNRNFICFICKKKPKKKSFKTSGKIGCEIKALFPRFDINDIAIPAVVCDACRLKIIRAKDNSSAKNSLKLPDYSKYNFKKKTRFSNSNSSYDCQCTLCTEVRAKRGNPNELKNGKKASLMCLKKSV